MHKLSRSFSSVSRKEYFQMLRLVILNTLFCVILATQTLPALLLMIIQTPLGLGDHLVYYAAPPGKIIPYVLSILIAALLLACITTLFTVRMNNIQLHMVLAIPQLVLYWLIIYCSNQHSGYTIRLLPLWECGLEAILLVLLQTLILYLRHRRRLRRGGSAGQG